MAHPVRRFTKRLIIFLNILVALGFLLGCYSYLFDPAEYWYAGFFALGAFYLFLILIIFIFFWLVAKPGYILISLLSIAIAWQPLKHLVKIRSYSDFSNIKKDGTLRVLDWNVEQFEISTYKTKPERKQQMLEIIKSYQPDVACFQEMAGSDSVPGAINYIPDLAKEFNMPYYYYSYNAKLDYDKDHRFGIIIFSKFPIIQNKSISHAPNNYNYIFQYADIVKDMDTFRVFNLHLQSLKFTMEDRRYLDEPTLDDEVNFRQSRNILYKFKQGFLNRQLQSQYVKVEVNRSPYPVIVCGDFNDVPNSYAYHRIGEGLYNAFAQKGSGIGRTYSHISPTLRIDNIFVDKRFSVLQYTKNNKRLSDHYPIVADLYYNKP